MERELSHFSHEHPLILKAEELKIDDGTPHHPDKIITCYGCSTPILGPFYRCSRECDNFFLHKVCAELPNEMNHPMHQNHPLTLCSEKVMACHVCSTPVISGFVYSCEQDCGFICHSACMFGKNKVYHEHNVDLHFGVPFTCRCNMCYTTRTQFFYNCSICSFVVDMKCATSLHAIDDKCHMHQLTPLQTPISFSCNICGTNRIGVSYKCKFCPFWVHQNCTLIPDKVKHSDHNHFLSLLPSPPLLLYSIFCDICNDELSLSESLYRCEQCLFSAHVRCATSDTIQLVPPIPRNQRSTEINQELEVQPALLPQQQKSTDLVSWFAENYTDRDAITNLILGLSEAHRDSNILNKEIEFFDHEHPLFLIDDDDDESGRICCACVLPISSGLCYGCVHCYYFLHKCCAELPKHILHPAHSQHQISLCRSYDDFFWCRLCFQISNGISYGCSECYFFMDTKCASLLRPVKHEGHKHPLTPARVITSMRCSACNSPKDMGFKLKCNTCSFSLCFGCAMAPPKTKHRYDEHPFVLTYYAPIKDHGMMNKEIEDDYLLVCDLCEHDLIPKNWFYHCHLCNQFSHLSCMTYRGATSQINYLVTYEKRDVHQHPLTMVSCTHSNSTCNKCQGYMKTGFSIGLQCIPCRFWIHLLCFLGSPDLGVLLIPN